MQKTARIRLAKTGYLAASVLLAVLGVLLLVCPEFDGGLLETLLGAGLLLCGVIRMMGYFAKDLYRLAFQFDLAFGLLLCLVGLAFLTRLVSGVPMTRTMIGVMILADGLFKIQIALDAKKFGLKKWSLIAVLAALAAAAGVLLAALPLESPAAMRVALGAALAADGALGLTVAVCTVKIIRSQNKRPEIDD